MSRLCESDISPNFSFSPFVFDSYDEDIHFFQHQHIQNPHSNMLLQDSLLSRDNSSETIAESEVYNNMEVFNNVGSIKKDTNDCSGGNGGVSKARQNKKSSISCEKPPRKRLFKKDRHSKIVTAQGPRDRRMRLSLDIARRFFMVQDMLGFDKASKTVEWLLIKSKEAIREFSRNASQSKLSCTGSVKSVSYASDGEVVSGIDEMSMEECTQQGNISNRKLGIGKEGKTRQTRKASFNPLAKESRAKARARARERTVGKMWTRSQQRPEVRLQNLQELRSSSYIEIDDESGSQSHDLKSSNDVATELEPSSHSLDCQGSIQDIVDQSFVPNKSSSSLFSCNQDTEMSQCLAANNYSFSNFSGCWDIAAGTGSNYCSVVNTSLSSGNFVEQVTGSFSQTSSDTTLQSQFADVQLYTPWDVYSYQHPCLPSE